MIMTVEYEGTGYLNVEFLDSNEVDFEVTDVDTGEVLEDGDTVETGNTLEFSYEKMMSDNFDEADVGDIVWFFGDGTIETGDTVQHEYTESDKYEITIQVENQEDDILATDRQIIKVE